MAEPPATDAKRYDSTLLVPGKILLDDFEVERKLGQGGMGEVFLVRSRSTGQRFAVKKTLALDAASRQGFLAELQTWIDLPDHPHLAACRFFRTVADEVLVFAEFVEGGSLAEWIQDRKLTRLDQILDVAIQFAWGVHAAHELGLIHQDIKPANVLMTSDGIAKVTDFGLARARASAGETTIGGGEQSMLVSSGGFTPAYCSPEQADAAAQRKAGVAPERLPRLTRRTDIWSWAVSVLEMFVGEPPTRHGGQIADAVFEAFLKTGSDDPLLPPMPDRVSDVLRKSLRRDPTDRWGTIAEAADALAHAYRIVAGQDYPRESPPSTTRHGRAAVQHDRRTISGVQWTDPREWLVMAWQADGRDASEADSIMPARTGSRKAQAIADLTAYDAARDIFERLVARGRKELETQLARLCIEKAFVHQNTDDIPGALSSYDRAIAIWERLVEQEGRQELADDLATAYQNKALAVWGLGDNRAAVALYDRAIAIWERLVEQEGRRELAKKLAGTYMNKALSVTDLGDNRTAVALYDRAIAIYERLVEQEGRRELANGLAMAYMNKALSVSHLGDNRAAVALYDRAIVLYERLVEQEGRRELADELATAYMNKAAAVSDLGDHRTAVALCERAIAIYERLVEQEGRRELLGYLAWVRTHRADILYKLGDIKKAQTEAREAVAALQAEVTRTGRADLKAALDWASTALSSVL